MVKDKNIMRISIISMTLSVLFIIGYWLKVEGEDSLSSISQPEYMDKIFQKGKVHEMDIQVDEKDWEYLLENAIQKEYIMGDVVIDGETFSCVGIRTKGNSSLTSVANDNTTDRYSLKIDFHEYVKNQTYYGLEKLALNNCIFDTTYMKEYLSYEMFEKMGIATPACSYVHMTINGVDWGLYLAVEVMEESFIERYFGSAEGNLYKPESTNLAKGGDKGNKRVMGPNFIPKDQEEMNKNENLALMKEEMGEKENKNMGPNGMSRGGTNLVYTGDDLSNYSGIFDEAVFATTTKKDYKKVVEMIKNLNEGTNLEEYLDVDEILKYFAVNTFLVNLDSYASNLKHNYYLYERNGIFQILPWDLNMSFAAFQMKDAQEAINFPIDTPVNGDTMENSPLISKLLEVDEYKERYYQYLRTLVTEYIESGEYEDSLSQIHVLIRDYVANDPTAFYTYEEYQKAVPVLLQFGYDRAKSVMAQLEGEQPSMSYGDISTSVDLSLLGSNGMGGPKKDRNQIAWDAPNEKPPWGDQKPNQGMGQAPSDRNGGNKGIKHPMDRKKAINKDAWIIIGSSMAALLIALLFAYRFQRRK